MSAPETRGAVQKVSDEVAGHDARHVAPAPNTNQAIEPLTREDANALKLYEHIIESGLKTFVDVGNALTYIRDARLYRETHSTFEEYCRGRWNIRRNYGNKLILAAQVIETLGTIVPILPTTETQARPLATLAPEEQREAWNEAVATAPRDATGTPKVTAKHVAETVERKRQTLRPNDQPAEPISKHPKTIGINDAVAALSRAVSGDRESAPTALATLRDVASRGLYGPQTRDPSAAFRGLIEIVALLLGVRL